MIDKTKCCGWVNVYGSDTNKWIDELYATKAAARKASLDLPEHIATVKIEWDEMRGR